MSLTRKELIERVIEKIENSVVDLVDKRDEPNHIAYWVFRTLCRVTQLRSVSCSYSAAHEDISYPFLVLYYGAAAYVSKVDSTDPDVVEAARPALSDVVNDAFDFADDRFMDGMDIEGDPAVQTALERMAHL